MSKELKVVKEGITEGIQIPSMEVAKERFSIMCSEQFKTYNATLSKINQIVINNDDDLKMAEQSVKEGAALVKTIDEYRKKQKEPFKTIVDVIDSTIKVMYDDPLKTALTNAKSSMTKYKVVQAAAAAAEAKKKEEEAEKLRKQLDEDRSLVDHRIRMATAKVFGGSFTKMNGEVVTFKMISTKEEVLVSIDSFIKKFPIKGVNEEFVTILRAVRDSSIKALKAMRRVIEDDVDIANRIADIKHVYDEEMEVLRNRIGIKIEKTVKNEVKSAQKAFAEVSKGLIQVISFNVTDLSKVPVEFLQVNEEALRKYTQGENREFVLEKIRSGEGDAIVAGISFSATTTTRVR